MRRPRKDIPSQPLTYLWERHKELARRVVAGDKPIDIAKSMNMTPCRVSIIMCSPAFKRYVESLRARVEIGLIDIRKEINKGAQQGVGLLYNLLTGDKEKPITSDDKFRAKLAQDFLDRDGHGKVTTVKNENVHIHLNANKIEELKAKRASILEKSRLAICGMPSRETISTQIEDAQYA